MKINLDKMVSDWTANQTREQVESTLQKAGIQASIVEKPEDVYKDEQLKHRHYWVPQNHEVMGEQLFEMQSCFILSKTPRQITRPSPMLGQHNEYIFKELLGMSDDEMPSILLTAALPRR